MVSFDLPSPHGSTVPISTAQDSAAELARCPRLRTADLEGCSLPPGSRAAELLARCPVLDDVNPAELSDRVHLERDLEELEKTTKLTQVFEKYLETEREIRETQLTTILQDSEHDLVCWKPSFGVVI